MKLDKDKFTCQWQRPPIRISRNDMPSNCVVKQIKAGTGSFIMTSKFGCLGNISHLIEEWVILLEPRRSSKGHNNYKT